MRLPIFLAPVVAGVMTLTIAQAQADAPGPELVRANRTLQRAGFPPIPDTAADVSCYSWSGLGAGVYAAFRLKDPQSYIAQLPAGLDRVTPVPREFLAPPNSAAPWFVPDEAADGIVFMRGRIVRGAPEIFRLFVGPPGTRMFLFYSWNNKRTYP